MGPKEHPEDERDLKVHQRVNWACTAEKKDPADNHWWETNFQIGNSVWLCLKNYKADCSDKKLDSQVTGPFLIVEQIEHSYIILIYPQTCKSTMSSLLTSYDLQRMILYLIRWLNSLNQSWLATIRNGKLRRYWTPIYTGRSCNTGWSVWDLTMTLHDIWHLTLKTCLIKYMIFTASIPTWTSTMIEWMDQDLGRWWREWWQPSWWWITTSLRADLI